MIVEWIQKFVYPFPHTHKIFLCYFEHFSSRLATLQTRKVVNAKNIV